MAIINSFTIGRNETKRFRIHGGTVQEVTQAEATECTGTALTVVASNAVGEIVTAGSAFEFSDACAAYPGAIIHTVIGSSIWSQPQPISYAISKNNVTRVIGSIGQSTTSGGGEDPEPPSDPNFGGETSVTDPEEPPAAVPPPPLPTGNGNTGFGSVASAGSELGITGGNN